MKTKIVYIERKFWEFVSIEKVFKIVSQNLDNHKFEFKFEKLKFGNNLKGIIKNLLTYKHRSADILHITGHIHYIALKLPPPKTVLTIHDLGFLHTNRGLKRYVLKKIYLDWPIKRLKYITTISEATKVEITNETKCDETKIRVIENPLSIQPNTKVKNKFDNKCPRILQIGTSANKNILNLIKAISDVTCILDIVGKLNEEQLKHLKKLEIRYESSSGLDDNEIVEKYLKADIVAFCSTFEGFGLPIVEAQAMKTPVITSNISPLREVAGNGAVLVDPYNSYEIKSGIQKIITDETLREKLVLNGLENIKRFDAKIISKKYQELYKEIIKDNSEINGRKN